MPVKHTSFLELAKESLDGQGREIDFRSSISKSYYCMYHSASRLTNGKTGKTDSNGNAFTGGVHKRFYSYLMDNAADYNGLDKDLTAKVGIMLKQSHALRISADYHLEHNITKPTAEMMFKRAVELERIISNLQK
ncbi:hypothetical protein C3369_06850 [Escherichia sp. ESNIH1]|uniref:hypothetical protein n=1 Tax=Escherichia sp. ESNIH1 TaxID=1985876 RepID=UPI000CDD2C3E|nr:hypothetical protein [Escherichia sp. ESNIH1]POU03536.1 hypothetical protein C3369_06850 [Escherichia sp. ESNIH1]